MYQNAAALAIFLVLYSAVAGRIGRSWLSGPIVFTVAGLVLGPAGLDLLRLELGANGLRLLAEAALAMVLFTDAAHADFATVRRNLVVPGRLLLIGLPLTIALGFAIAALLFPQLEVLELALLATILAPTDAALGKPVVTNENVPAVLRESLNVESGLNDEKLFIGWFGPRGLASIVFAIIVFDEHLPGAETLEAVVALTVLLSVVAHGVTANPLVEALRKPAIDGEREPLMRGG